jgi:quercetin dioxygenase-like cupin family protein
MSYYFNPADRTPLERRPGLNLRTAWMQNLLLSYVDIAPDTEAPIHKHPEEQITAILRGEITMTIGGETRLCKAGDICMIPGDVEHGGIAGAEGVNMIDIFSPIRKDLQY